MVLNIVWKDSRLKDCHLWSHCEGRDGPLEALAYTFQEHYRFQQNHFYPVEESVDALEEVRI